MSKLGTKVPVSEFWILGNLLDAAYVLETNGAEMCMVGKGEVAKRTYDAWAMGTF